MNISMDKKYKTRDGRDVRILCVDKKDVYPVVALIPELSRHDREICVNYQADGQYNPGCQSPRDLIEQPDEVYRTLSENGNLGNIRADSLEKLFADDGTWLEDCPGIVVTSREDDRIRRVMPNPYHVPSK